MLADALKFLADQAIKSTGPKVFHPEGEPSHIYYIDNERHEADPNPRRHTARDLSAIIKMARENEGDFAVWYNADKVTLLLDDATRRDRVTLQLETSKQLDTLRGWEMKSPPFKQTQIVMLLRTMFKHCTTQCPKLIDILRQLKFKQSMDGSSTVSVGKSSVGRKIEAETFGVEQIPEEIYFNVPIFAEPFAHMEAIIEVAIDVDPGTESFTIHTIPGSVAKAIALGETVIGAELVEALGEARVFYGSAVESK